MFVCRLHISSLSFAVVYFAFACAPYSDFFKGFVVVFQAFCTVVVSDILLYIFRFSEVPILFVIHRYYTHMI